MTVSPRMARSVDHLVLPTADIALVRSRLSSLGFTVAADARHPFGTENACVFLADQTYLEPLGVASREECEAAARNGNVFVARDQAFRFRCGQEGLSAIVLATGDAAADHAHFRETGFSAGDMLEFSRPMKLPDGTQAVGSFRLAFAADLRAPDFFLFNCQRVQALPADRSALETHANGVTGLSEIVLAEPNPTDFQYLLQEAFDQREVSAHSFGMDLVAANAKVTVLNPEGMQAFFGLATERADRGLRGQAVVFTVADLTVTEALLAGNGVGFERRENRILVAAAPGQGVLFAFEEQS